MRRAMAQGILSFMGAWNNYLGPQMFIDSYEWYHMTQALDWLDRCMRGWTPCASARFFCEISAPSLQRRKNMIG